VPAFLIERSSDYQITRSTHPRHSSHPIPIIPIWRRFMRCTPEVRQKVMSM
jgi:hypothetical protein